MNNSLFHGNLVSSNRIIYTPSPFAKANLLHLQEIGQLQAQKPHTSQRTNLHSYLFFVVESGSGTLRYHGTDYSLQQGDCVFLNCTLPYAHCSSEDLWALKWVHFYGANINDIYDKYLQDGGQPVFTCRNITKYNFLIEELFTIASSEDSVKDMKINEKLSALLTLLMTESCSSGSDYLQTGGRRDLSEIRNYLAQNYAHKITLDALSDTFYINKFYMTRLFKEQFGVSINSYLLQTRITHAKQLLRFSDLSIEKIGQECGMNDANYFSRMFKKIEGVAPGEYRKRW